jgi:hypothetical protein
MRLRSALLLALLAAGLAACESPEARRTRGAGPGADVGNRRPVVDMHQGAQPYYKTPCVTIRDKCPESLPISGIPTFNRA